MRYEIVDLVVVQGATGVGTSFRCADYIDKTIQVTGIAGGATIRTEVSIDGTNFVQTGSDITANGLYEVSDAVKDIRINRTVQGTGNPVVKLGFRNARSD